MPSVDSLFDQALQLSPEDRAALAQRILDTLETGSEYLSEQECESLWAREIRARSDALARGELETFDWRVVMDRVRRRMIERRNS